MSKLNRTSKKMNFGEHETALSRADVYKFFSDRLTYVPANEDTQHVDHGTVDKIVAITPIGGSKRRSIEVIAKSIENQHKFTLEAALRINEEVFVKLATESIQRQRNGYKPSPDYECINAIHDNIDGKGPCTTLTLVDAIADINIDQEAAFDYIEQARMPMSWVHHVEATRGSDAEVVLYHTVDEHVVDMDSAEAILARYYATSHLDGDILDPDTFDTVAKQIPEAREMPTLLAHAMVTQLKGGNGEFEYVSVEALGDIDRELTSKAISQYSEERIDYEQGFAYGLRMADVSRLGARTDTMVRSDVHTIASYTLDDVDGYLSRVTSQPLRDDLSIYIADHTLATVPVKVEATPASCVRYLNEARLDAGFNISQDVTDSLSRESTKANADAQDFADALSTLDGDQLQFTL